MFKNFKVKSIISGFVAAIMLCSVPAYASSTKKEVKAVYNNIKIYVDGARVIPKDVNGNIVDPFIIDGTTYLPVRALANALGQGVEWNQETSTVIIGGEAEIPSSGPSLAPTGEDKGYTSIDVTAVYNDIKIVVDGNEVTPKDVNGNLVEPFIIDGTTYLPVRALANALGEDVSWQQSTSTVYIGEQPFRVNADILKQFADKTLVEINDSAIKGSFYNVYVAQMCNDFYFNYQCDNYSAGKTLQELTIDSVPVPEILASQASNSFVIVCAIYDYAVKNGFLNREDIQTAVSQYMEDYLKQFASSAEYNGFLAECGVTAQEFEEFIKVSVVYQLFTDDLYTRYASIPYTDDEFIAMCEENYITAKHILVSDEETAKNIIKEIKNGASFDDLSSEHNLDPGASPAGYTFTTGEMVPEFEEAAFNLKENQLTQTPVKSTYGYHVILRLPLDTVWIEGNKSTVISNLAASETNSVLDKILSETKVNFTDNYHLYFSTIK